MELSKNKTKIYEKGEIVEVLEMTVDSQIECMELSKSCAKTGLTGLERGQQLRKYNCIARRYHRFIDLLSSESLRKTYTYLDDPWRAANGARFFNPPPVTEYDAWMEVLHEEARKFEKQAEDLEADGGIIYEDVAPCKDGPRRNDRAEDGAMVENGAPASDDGVIVNKVELDEPGFVRRVTVIRNSATVKMENSVIEVDAIGNRNTIAKMEAIGEDDGIAQKGVVRRILLSLGTRPTSRTRRTVVSRKAPLARRLTRAGRTKRP